MLSVLSRRAAKRASSSLVDTEIKLEWRSNRATILSCGGGERGVEEFGAGRDRGVTWPREANSLVVMVGCGLVLRAWCVVEDLFDKSPNVIREDIGNS